MSNQTITFPSSYQRDLSITLDVVLLRFDGKPLMELL